MINSQKTRDDSDKVRRKTYGINGSIRKQISAAAGRTKAKLVLKHAKIVNVFTETVEEGDIAMEDGIILGIGNYEGELERDLKGAYVCPGFLDGHIHLESSMVSPSEFERMVVPHGPAR